MSEIAPAQQLGADGVGDDRRPHHPLDPGRSGHRGGEQEEDPDRRRAGERRHGQGQGDHDQRDLAAEQQEAAVEAVRERPAEQRGDDQRHQLGAAEQTGEKNRVGDHEHLVGQSDQGRLGAEPGYQRTAVSSRKSRDSRSPRVSTAIRKRNPKRAMLSGLRLRRPGRLAGRCYLPVGAAAPGIATPPPGTRRIGGRLALVQRSGSRRPVRRKTAAGARLMTGIALGPAVQAVS